MDTDHVRAHNAHHDDPEDLPLLTESGRVVEVSPLDENRMGEIRHATAQILAELDRADLVDDGDHPSIDWEGVTAITDDPDGFLEARLATLQGRYERAYPSLLSLQVESEDADIDFVPGQYVTLHYDGTPRAYSLAGSPTDPGLEFCIRRVPGGRLTSDLFETVGVGDEVSVRGPYGEFVLDESSPRDMAFLATGTGVAPLKSMLQYTFDEGLDEVDGEPRDCWLFLGCAWRDDLPYREFFRDLADDHDNFHFVPTLSRESALTDWDGETAYVQRTFVKYLADDVEVDGPIAEFHDEAPATDVTVRIDPDNLDVYACGVSAMVQTLVEVVQQAGVPADRVQGEGFG